MKKLLWIILLSGLAAIILWQSSETVLWTIIWASLCIIVGIAAIFSLASADILFTFVKEGSVKVVLKMGAFHRAVMQFKGFKLDKNYNVVTDKSWWSNHNPFGGLRWLGLPFIYSVHRYYFRWISIRPQTGEVLKRKEKLDFILVRDDVYAVEVKEAESKGMAPLNITLLLTMCCVNPYKALFKAQDWSEMIFNRSGTTFRESVAFFSFEELVQQKQAIGGDLYKKLDEQGLLEIFAEEYGVKVKAVEMALVSPAGSHSKEIEEAASKKWAADREKDRIQTLADAEVGRIGKVYGKIQEFGELGTAVRFMESLDKAGEKPGNWIIPFGDVKSAIKELIGKEKTNQGGKNNVAT